MRSVRSLALLLIVVALTPSLAHAVTRYVTTTGSPAGDGSTQSPYDLATALTIMAPGDVVYIANGAYTWTESVSGLLPIQDGCVIEGGFDPDTWAKDSGASTSITVGPELHAFANTYGYYVGIDASQHVGFAVRDLALSVLPGGASGVYEHRGISVYGVHLDQCSNYEFTNVSIAAGAASNGENGDIGANGAAGEDGGPGSAVVGTTCGHGGAGGAGAGNNTTPGTTACYENGADGGYAYDVRMAGSGGAGGGGGYFAAPAGNGGNGGYVNSVPGGAGGAGAYGNCGPPYFNGGPAGSGALGTSGQGFDPGARAPIVSANRARFFEPEAAPSGGDGAGGSGGGGGGGGGAAYFTDTHCMPAHPGIGGAAGGGGGGGEGGAGGSGGYGGGSSYAVYLFRNGANTSFSGVFSPGAAGLGGDGGLGGGGGVPGRGGIGASGSGDAGRGSSGGGGGWGGDGGRGQDGANGEAVTVMTASGTLPSIGAVAVDDVRPSMGFALHAGQPNPTASFSRIDYDLPRAASVSLRVFDAQGRVVRLLASGVDSPGRKSLRWDLRDDGGTRVRAGLYFYRFTADRFEALQRVIVLD